MIGETQTKIRKSTFKCPDCQSSCRITKTKILSVTYKEFYVSCTNDNCGARYVFGSEPVRTLIPSQIPNPTIQIPLARATKPTS